MSNNLRSCLLKVRRDAAALRQLCSSMKTLSTVKDYFSSDMRSGEQKRNSSTPLILQQIQPCRGVWRNFATKSSNLQIEVATRKHAKDIENYMLEEFSVNEPISRSLKVTKDDVYDFFRDLAENGYSHEKYSTVVYDKDRLVAMMLCAVKNNADDATIPPEIDAERHDFAEEIRNGPYKQHKANQIFTYVYAIEHRQKRLLGTNSKVFKLDVLGVHRDYRGLGLGKQLTERSIKKARAEGCQWVATAATARASQGIFTRMGFQTPYEIPYSVFRENGKPVFQDLHDGCKGGKFMVLRLTN